ncbi:MAG TPA: 23S rRNA (uridine(2552)-2'-O)-methyltransferase RlmE [Gammaproteobacteria bacterium]|nr:23S rRNA (uridine(2552)-2'-O)-methyltransferase RlmE [Gammaproteobacteria bacterium]
MARAKSSKRWLRRHFSDAYVKDAHRSGYRSRAVYKLLEIDQHARLFKRGMTVVDLGAAPGGWSQVAAGRVGPAGRVIALDVLPMDPLPGVTFIQGDFREEAVLESLMRRLSSRSVDLVISDMAPNLSGVKCSDQARAMDLAGLALDLARNVLGEQGAFLVKVFQGAGFDDYIRALRQTFATVVTRKPKASRPDSREVYLLARNYVL